MTTLEEDYKALVKRSQEEKAHLIVDFFDGKHAVDVVYLDGKILIVSGCRDGSEPMLGARFSPELMLDLLPALTKGASKGVCDILKLATKTIDDLTAEVRRAKGEE